MHVPTTDKLYVHTHAHHIWFCFYQIHQTPISFEVVFIVTYFAPVLAIPHPQAISPAVKRDFPGRMVEPAQYFARFIQANLRIVICLPSSHHLVNEHSK